MKKLIKAGKHAVLSKNGEVFHAQKAEKALIIECADDLVVTEKTTLTAHEKTKLKSEQILKQIKK
jgi:hypothetical protein